MLFYYGHINNAKRIIVEINTFANPYPYVSQNITSFIAESLLETNQQAVIEQYDFSSFSLNVLDKRRTMIEKLISLFAFHSPKMQLKQSSPKSAISMICII
ncbi:hypothetical protein EZS27_011740 [termite gut metagenome]|uniref:Uncharacterized protein n=1 Tax=termite gut metagenome TaxID=433724 RepID=A0A5J4S2Q8_9ZZZZ